MKPEDLARRLDPAAFATKREQAMQKATLIALAAAQKRTPVRTGTLRRSETTRVEAGGLRGFVGTNVEYAPFVHARVPFFEEGLADAQADIVEVFRQAGVDFFEGAVE